jgi:hypothetical protein
LCLWGNFVMYMARADHINGQFIRVSLNLSSRGRRTKPGE